MPGSTAARRQWSFDLLLEGVAELPQTLNDGTDDTRTGEGKSAELWTLKDGAGPATLVDLDGASRAVWFTGYEERVEATRLGRSLRGRVELVEA